MVKQILVFSLLLVFMTAQFTFPDEWLKKGFDIRDGIFQELPGYNLQIDTKCSEVDLTKAPYNYNGTVMSGYLKINKGNSVLGFIFYGKENVERSKINTIPTVIWLNGGPGFSSQFGNFNELGPFWIVPSKSKPYDIIRNKNGWTNDYNILFVDNPVGTGLSYADPTFSNVYATNQAEMANDFYAALKQLYNNPNACFQRLNIRGDHPLFVMGKSFAGKFVPAIGQKILRQAKQNKGFLTGLKGIAIGNGFTHPMSTLSMMGEYAYNFGLLDYQQRTKVEQYLLNATYQDMNRHYKECHDSFNNIVNYIINVTGGINIFDVTRYEQYPRILVEQFMNNPQVIAQYGLEPSIKFGSQGANVNEALFVDFMQSVVGLVEKILQNHDIQVLVYNGQNDLICCTAGTMRWVERVHYADSDKFRDTLLTPWRINKKVVGFYKRVGKLWLRNVNDASHMLIMDQGEVALAMINDFIKGTLGENVEEATQEQIRIQTD